MARCLFRLAVLAVAVFLVLPARGQEKPKDAPKDGALPAGAKVRLGGTGLQVRFTPHFTLVAPDYKTFLVPDLPGSARRFDVATGRALDKGEPVGGGQIIVSGDGKRFINVRSGMLTVRDVETGKAIQELKMLQGFGTGFAGSASIASISKDGKVVAQGGQSNNAMGVVIVYDVEKNESIFQAGLQHQGLPIPVLSADGKFLATRRYQPVFVPPGGKGDPNAGRKVQVWEVEAGKELFTAVVPGSGAVVTGMAFSADSKLLALSCGDGPIELWDVAAAKSMGTIFGRTRQGIQVAFSPDGKTLAAVAADGTIQRWNVSDRKLLDATELSEKVPMAMAQGLVFADNERVIAWGVTGLWTAVWEAPSGKVLSTVPEHTTTIRSIAFTAGGKEIVTAGTDGRIVRWDANTGKLLGPIVLRTGRASRGGFTPGWNIAGLSPDGTRAMIGGSPATVFDLATGMEALAVPGSSNPGASMFTLPSHDFSKAITFTTSSDQKLGSCVVWDLVAQKKLAEMELGPNAGTMPVAAISPSGERMVIASFVRNAMVTMPTPSVMTVTGWDLKTGKKLGQVEDKAATWQFQIAAASESTAIISSGMGNGMGKLRLYDYATGKLGEELDATTKGYEQNSPIVMSPDGKLFALGVSTGEQGVFGVRIHEWPSAKVLHTFTGHSGPVSALAFSEDGTTLASGGHDSTVLVWDLSAIGKK